MVGREARAPTQPDGGGTGAGQWPQHEHEQRRWSEHAELGQVAVAAAREAAAAALAMVDGRCDSRNGFTRAKVILGSKNEIKWKALRAPGIGAQGGRCFLFTCVF